MSSCLSDCGNHADISHVHMSAHTLPRKPCFPYDGKLDADAQATTHRPGRIVFLFAGTGNCVQFPFQSVPIDSLAWLGKDLYASCDCCTVESFWKQARVGGTLF